MDDLISRQAAVSRISDLLILELKGERLPTWNEVYNALGELPSAQSEYTEHEKSILTMLFEIAKLIIDLQGGYMEMADGRFFDNNDLFDLAEKLEINY